MIDKIDESIIAALHHDGKATMAQLGKRAGVPATTAHNRVKRLEREGIIRGYAPVLDHTKLGRGIAALIFVTVESKAGGHAVDQEHLAHRLATIDGIENARIVTGGFDILLDARVETVEELNTLITKELRKIPGVDKTQTMLILKEMERRR